MEARRRQRSWRRGIYYLAKPDLSLRINGGRYLRGDTGFTVGLLRRFGDTEVGVSLVDTSSGPVGLLSLALPLGPSRLGELPSLFRVRPPDYFNYTQSVLLARQNGANQLAPAIDAGQQLSVGMDARTLLMARDRLYRDYIVRSLPQLRRFRPVQ